MTDLTRLTDISKAQLLIPQVALDPFSTYLQPRVRLLNQIFILGPVVLHWIVVTNGIWASCTVCLPVTMEAGQLMSKTLPPKINLHSEEREGGRKGVEGGRRRKGKSLSTGTEGKESPFQWNKNCAISIRTVCSDRGGSFLSRKWISVVSSDD